MRAYPVLAIVSNGCPEPLGRFPRVTHPSATFHFRRSFSFDLHVLSLPPAFVLSQDQTLKFDSSNRHLMLNVLNLWTPKGPFDEFPLFRIQSGSQRPQHKYESGETRTITIIVTIAVFCCPSQRLRHARTPPSTFLFLYLQCQTATRRSFRAKRNRTNRQVGPATYYRPRKDQY